jgi:anthranilate phosphoribosyltransferase
MRKHMTPIRSRHTNFIDTCGTGGDGSSTFNISTAAAIVTAASGLPVAKHGNRSITSKTGSADVLAELGVNINAPVETVERCLDETGICFCFAPQLHPAMKHVAAVRKKLGFPTIFNLLGPLCNPASAPFQLLGVGKPEIRGMMAEALSRLETRHAIVVTGEDAMDEVTLSGKTFVSEVQGKQVTEFEWWPTDFGLEVAEKEEMIVNNSSESAALIREILDGRSGPSRDIVVLNAAAALWTAGIDRSTINCARRAQESIDNGSARELLKRLAEVSNP